MEGTIKTGIPPSADMEDVNVSRLDDSEADNTGATAGADESPCTDPEGGGTGRGAEADCKEDPGDSSHPGADAEGSGEVSRDEPGTAPEADAEKEKAAVKEAAEKLKSWMNAFKEPVEQAVCLSLCEYLIKRCRQDAGFAQDVLNKSKTWNGMWRYLAGKARKFARPTGNSTSCAMIRANDVYEWAEDYIRKEPDKEPQKTGKNNKKSQENCTKPAENAQSATENAQSEQDPVQDAQEVEQDAQEVEQDAPEVEQQEPKKKPAKPKKQKPKAEEKKPEKPKKEKKDKAEMDGQIDLFSLFG